MKISRIEMTKPHIDREHRLCRADVAIHLALHDAVADQVVHLKCKSITTGIESHQHMLDGLLIDALRQMRWMPEFRAGHMSLEDLPRITGVNTL